MFPRTNHFSNVFVERNDWPADRRTTSIHRVQCCRFGDKRALGVEWSSIYLHRGYQQLAATLTPCLRSLLPLPSFVVAPPKRDHWGEIKKIRGLVVPPLPPPTQQRSFNVRARCPIRRFRRIVNFLLSFQIIRSINNARYPFTLRLPISFSFFSIHQTVRNSQILQIWREKGKKSIKCKFSSSRR